VALNEVEFLFRARDEVSTALAAINAAIKQTGDESERVAKKMAVYGTETSKVTRFIREQRREQRDQAFLFREATQVIQAGALALSAFGLIAGNSSKEMRTLSNSLNAGFIAFQSVSFLLARANPILSLAASAVAGLAGAFASFKSADAAEGAEQLQQRVKQITDAVNSLDKGNLDAIKDYVAFLSSGKTREAAEAVKELNVSVAKTPDIAAGLARAFGGSVGVIKLNEETARRMVGTAEKIKDLSFDELITRNQIGAVVLVTADSEELRLKKLQEQARLLELQSIFAGRVKDLTIAGAVELSKQNNLIPLPPVRVIPPQLTPTLNVQEQVIANLREMGTTTEQVGDVITNTMTNAADIMAGVFTGAIDRIDEAFKSLIQSMIAELIKIGLLKLFSALVTSGGSVVADTVGTALGRTAISPAGTGGSTVNIFVAPETRSISVADKRRAMRVIEEAIFTEK
jgi:hypothetical protein